MRVDGINMLNLRLLSEIICLHLYFSKIFMGFEVIYRISSPNCNKGDILSMQRVTIDLYNYGLSLDNRNDFTFEVMAERDIAVFGLDTTSGSTAVNAYQVLIGFSYNKECRISEVHNGIKAYELVINGKYADNTIYKPFWFSWENGNIRAGQGSTVGQQTFLAWTDPDPIAINGIGIQTCWGVTGEWKIKVEVKDESTGFFKRCDRSNTKAELPIIGDYSFSKVSCGVQCGKIESCFGFNYHLGTQRCELVSFGIEPLTNIVWKVQTNWNFYSKCYRGKSVCAGCSF